MRVQIQPRLSQDAVAALDAAVKSRRSTRGVVLEWMIWSCLDPDGRPKAPSEEIPRQLTTLAQRVEEVAATQQQLLTMLTAMQQASMERNTGCDHNLCFDDAADRGDTAPVRRRARGWQCTLWWGLIAPWLLRSVVG